MRRGHRRAQAAACEPRKRGPTPDGLPALFRLAEPDWRVTVRTAYPIEPRFLEVRRGIRPMGVTADKASRECLLHAVLTRGNRAQGAAGPCLETQIA